MKMNPNLITSDVNIFLYQRKNLFTLTNVLSLNQYHQNEKPLFIHCQIIRDFAQLRLE